ncbi:hypothetical protein VTO73DRAFT_10196 [Trametes versicolor]
MTHGEQPQTSTPRGRPEAATSAATEDGSACRTSAIVASHSVHVRPQRSRPAACAAREMASVKLHSAGPDIVRKRGFPAGGRAVNCWKPVSDERSVAVATMRAYLIDNDAVLCTGAMLGSRALGSNAHIFARTEVTAPGCAVLQRESTSLLCDGECSIDVSIDDEATHGPRRAAYPR